MIIEHFLELLVLHFVHLKLCQAINLLLSHLNFLLGLFFDPSHSRFWDIFTILQCLLPWVYFFDFLFFSIGPWRPNPVRITTFHLVCKLLYYDKFTCILSIFFFFSTHSSPPMFAPSPPIFTHSFDPPFFFYRLRDPIVVFVFWLFWASIYFYALRVYYSSFALYFLWISYLSLYSSSR